MTNSTRIAGLVGPALIAITVTEQNATVVYASLVALLATGVVLTFKSYGRGEG